MEPKEEIANKIIQYQKNITEIEAKINRLAKEYIPDFHFMDHMVSTFWRCDKSPIGMCVFHLNTIGKPTECRYCYEPNIRK